MKKKYGLLFLVISSVKNLTWELINVQKVFWQKLEVITSFLLHVFDCWKHKILKRKRIFPIKENGGLFFRIIECDKC